MTIQQEYQSIQYNQKRNVIFLLCALVLIMATISLDFLYSKFYNTSFYISESALFSSFWLLIFLLLKIEIKFICKSKKLADCVFIALTVLAVFLFSYPALVWLVSDFFFFHTFSYWQTFNFGLTEHFIKVAIIFSMPLIVAWKGNGNKRKSIVVEEEMLDPVYSSSIIVTETGNKKTAIATNDILYFSARSPYITIHHKTRNYLHAETLKSLEAQLDANQFIRIHKSYIVNIKQVISYQSRLNGDYDLNLSDNTSLRVSRNYAADFKSGFGKYHRVTAK